MTGPRSSTFSLGDARFVVISTPAERPPPLELTGAESDVLARLLAGRSNAEIARARGTSPRTVANQIASIFEKVGVSSRTELAVALHRLAAEREAPGHDLHGG